MFFLGENSIYSDMIATRMTRIF